MAVRIQFQNKDKVIKDFLVNETRLMMFGAQAVEAVTKVLFKAVKDNATLTDHTLEDLAEMGHPYSTRAPQDIHDPNWLVHTQSGELASALYSTSGHAGSIIWGEVGINVDEAPHVLFVIYGTSKMVSRDFFAETINEEADNLLAKFMAILRTKMK
ncbi:MAG: hypothetical protein GY847_01410 [Proteobacteria bacterium]|nr:hypothetical protein [Pseudomonadota bacterium]